MKMPEILKRFSSYQKERFPIIILGLSLFPAILSSGVVLSVYPTALQIVSALIASLAYLLHIRVIDEDRDFEHDNLNHATRPVQRGVISREELHRLDMVALVLFILVAVSAGAVALMTGAVMLVYSFLARKEFFIGDRIRRHFFVYNAVNLVQMLLMQLFVYAVFANPFPFSTLILAHFLFTTVGTVVFEFVRKVKRPGDDGTGKDTYTWHLGFHKALLVYLSLLFLNALLFFRVATLISTQAIGWLVVSLGLAILASLSALVHWRKRTHQTDQIMQLSFLILYGIFNLIIYFLIRS